MLRGSSHVGAHRHVTLEKMLRESPNSGFRETVLLFVDRIAPALAILRPIVRGEEDGNPQSTIVTSSAVPETPHKHTLDREAESSYNSTHLEFIAQRHAPPCSPRPTDKGIARAFVCSGDTGVPCPEYERAMIDRDRQNNYLLIEYDNAA